MCCKSFWKTWLPFFITFLVGVFIATAFHGARNAKPAPQPLFSDGNGRGGGSGNDLNCLVCKDGHHEENVIECQNNIVTSIQITSKPRPSYTNEARENQTQGTVALRVTFLQNGQIGKIAPVSALPNGLTENAIEAARQIKFIPATRNGKPVTVTKTLQYTFTLY